MKLTIYVLRERLTMSSNDYNVRSTTDWKQARAWVLSDVSLRGFDTMQVEIPDDMVWEK